MGCVRVQSDSVDENVDGNENIKRPEFDFETAVLKWKKSKDRSGDSRYSRQIFKDITSNPDNELEAKTKKVTDKVSETLNVIANEPSLAFFRIQEHVRKCLPQLVETKHEVQELQEKIQGSSFDTEYAANTLKEMQSSSAHFENMHDLLKNAIFMKQQIDYEKSRREQEKLHPSMYTTKSSPNINYPDERPARLSRHHSTSSDRTIHRSREKRVVSGCAARPHSSSGVSGSVGGARSRAEKRSQYSLRKIDGQQKDKVHGDRINNNKSMVTDAVATVDKGGADSETVTGLPKSSTKKETKDITVTTVKSHDTCRQKHEKGKSVFASKANKTKYGGSAKDERVKDMDRRRVGQSSKDDNTKETDRSKTDKLDRRDSFGMVKSSKGSRKGSFRRDSKPHKHGEQTSYNVGDNPDKFIAQDTKAREVRGNMKKINSHLGEKETITPVTSLATDGEPYHVLNSGGTSIKADEAEVSKTDENYTN